MTTFSQKLSNLNYFSKKTFKINKFKIILKLVKNIFLKTLSRCRKYLKREYVNYFSIIIYMNPSI